MAENLKPLRLLVADDESATRMMSRAMLERRGHAVTEAADGRQAVEAAATAQPPFDAVLLDLHMPDCDGLEALGLIRADADPARAGVAVIMLTAISDPAVERKLLDEGADAVLAMRWESLAPALAAAVCAAAGDEAPPPAAMLSPIERLAADLAPEKVRRLLDIAHASLAQHQIDLAAAASRGEQAETSRLAHRIAGVAGTYGCDRLREAAATLEREAERLDGAALTVQVRAMDDAFAQALTALRQGPKPHGR